MIWIAAAVAQDDLMEELFPPRPLASWDAAKLLAPARIGPPARTYDQTTSTGVTATPEELAVEAELAKALDLAPAPDDLRRYGRLILPLYAAGRPLAVHRWFLAEHAGLATVPVVAGTFFVETPDPTVTTPLVLDVARDAGLQTLAVVLEPDPRRGVTRGIVVGLEETGLPPFPRAVPAGATLEIPVAEGDALYVAGPGADVGVYPSGTVQVETGRYRCAIGGARKHAAPERPFFFTIYAGIDPPIDMYAAGVVDLSAADPDAGAGFVARVNAERARFGLPPMAGIDRGEALFAGLPDGEAARWRELALAADPLPDRPHGAWQPAWLEASTAAEAAWTALEHPMTRAVLLDPEFELLVTGTRPTADGFELVTFAVAPDVDATEVRDELWDALAASWKGAGPVPAPELEARLDVIAAAVAIGATTPKQAGRDVQRWFDRLSREGVVGGAAKTGIAVVPIGKPVGIDDFAAPPGAIHLAIGKASGDLGVAGGIQHTVLVYMAVTTAR